jgi:hypothetical protein
MIVFQVILEHFIVIQQIKKFPAFTESEGITLFTKILQWALYWAI